MNLTMTHAERRAKAEELRDEAAELELEATRSSDKWRRKCLRRAADLRNEAYLIEFGKKRGQ